MTWLMLQAEEAIERIQAQKGVEGVIVVNPEGIPIESNLDHRRTLHYTYNFQQLLTTTQRVLKELDPEDEAVLLDIETKKNDILVSTAKDCFMIAIRKSKEAP
ncbi:dynein light chain roadblock-type 1-like [Puntigrus tetrazona]|uniref:dynein light chain roadblock-type 1-like n=1 Tax=Puntigrus tetrazona TaxID=1606681 RepID=UPI001C8AF301|nr:dynein light chain roadblock-type 1-like [Puntigrus tetrazona]